MEIMDTSKEKDEKYEKVVLALNRTICDNLLALLEARDLSKRSFCKQLAEEKTSVTRTYFSKMLKNPQHISAAFLLSCCDFFGISLLYTCHDSMRRCNEYDKISKDLKLINKLIFSILYFTKYSIIHMTGLIFCKIIKI